MRTTVLSHKGSLGQPPLLIIERFLRDREGVWQQIKLEHDLNNLIRQMLVSSIVALAGYGAVMGVFHSLTQALASAIKLPLVFLMTLAICLPTLYLFNLLLGGRISAHQSLALVLSAITVTSIFSLAFAPITLFILITARGYLFYNLLNVSILALTGAVGLVFLVSGVRHINLLSAQEASLASEEQAAAPVLPPRRQYSISTNLISLWLMVYALVGTQLSWTLRPFIGSPGSDFQLFRYSDGSFYHSIFYIILNLVR